jgi:endonuclease/exonuclease/phosphatase family metal-dependent hydrolase
VPHTICTFNVNNLFVRYKFGQTFPGDVSGKSAVTEPGEGYLPMYNPAEFDLFRPEQRAVAALALGRGEQQWPDVVCLQEVESLIALRTFNELHLGGSYEEALLIDSRDLRQIDVGVLSRLPILDIRTHVDDRQAHPDDPEHPWTFSRDCLEVDLDLGDAATLTLFVNHLKSKFIDYHAAQTPEEKEQARQRNDATRRRQAEAVREIVAARFPGSAFDEALFAVVGDLNDEPASGTLDPLVHDAGLVPALERIATESDRWTHWYRSENTVAQLDHVLLSPALAEATDGAVPQIERHGISYARTLADGGVGPRQTHFLRTDDDANPTPVDFRFDRFAEVTPDTYASDHCPVFFEVP